MFNLKRFLKSVLWTFPFLSFFFGYFLTNSFFHKKIIAVPNIIGKSIHEAVKEATESGLNLRLLREKVDADIVDGIVLEQKPSPRRCIKPNQFLFVTLSKRPDPVIAPNILGEKQTSILERAKKLGIRTKTFWIESSHPKGSCVAQVPDPGLELNNEGLATYLSAGNSRLFIFPRLCGLPLVSVKEFLEKEGIKVEIFHKDRSHKGMPHENCIVLDQKPMAGTIIDKNLYVQLQVGKMKK
ncbi:MAG: PASTA domain-containing protein [Alphaproteobacteria bacterium]